MMVTAPCAYGIEGDGTAENPYLITSAADLQKINEDVTAHYKLIADIDLNNELFTPIGNVDTGAFSGTFDGSGYTISNLKIDAGKYAGLFGCNEGTIKNVKIKDANVYGSRYVGGILGQNEEGGIVESCSVENGKVYADTGVNDIYVGGICGYNNGELSGTFYNSADIDSPNYAGGIVAYSASSMELTAENHGNVSGKYAAGLIAWAKDKIEITDSSNCGMIKNTSTSNDEDFGGLCGVASDVLLIANSWNSGDVDGGGLIGTAEDLYGVGNCQISNSYNSGNCVAGIAVSLRANTTIKDSFNSGTCDFPISGKFNKGSSKYIVIENFYNTGNWTSTYDVSLGEGSRDFIAENCYEAGNGKYVAGTNTVSSDELFYHSGSSGCYYRKGSETKGSRMLSDEEMQNKDNYSGWDFENVWEIDLNVNNGMPILRNAKSPLMLNYSVKTLVGNESLQLVAYKDGNEYKDVEWSVTKGGAKVTNDGLVTPYVTSDYITISAVDSDGNRANCNIRYVDANNKINIKENASYEIGSAFDSSNSRLYYGFGANDFLTEVVSSNPEIVSIDGWSDSYISLKRNAAGTAVITLRSAGGAEASCKVTITNAATAISLESSYLSVPIDETKAIVATTTPSVTSSTITWTSSDEKVATVDAQGNVTGCAVGSTVITATTDTGYSASCNVTVTAPVKHMEFTQDEVNVYINDAVNLELVTDPVATTDTITYSSSYSSRASVTSDGTVTGNFEGTVTITARASSGQTATCKVNVLNYPTIVTGVTLDQESHDMKTGEVFKLNATLEPSNATDKAIVWESTDSSVASVSQTGTVSAVGAGKAVITATSGNGVIASCEVFVTGVASTNLSRIYIPEVFNSKSEIVTVPVMIEHNPGISFINFTVSYDADKMEPIEISNGDLFDSVMGSIDKENGKVKLIYTSDYDVTEDGVLANIKFKRKNHEEEITSLSVNYYPSNVLNAANTMVAFTIADGCLNSYHSTICGDVDENREVDFIDAIYLKRYVAGWSQYQDVSLKTGNLNSDEKINAADVVILENHIAGWTGYEDISTTEKKSE